MSRRKNWALWIVLASILALGAGWLMADVIERHHRRQNQTAGLDRLRKMNNAGLPIGARVEAFEAVDVQSGQPVKLFAKEAEAVADPIVVTLFSVRCAACDNAGDLWMDLQAECDRKKVKSYWIALESDLEAVKQFSAKHGMSKMRVLSSNRAVSLLKVQVIPITYVFRPDGQVAARWAGLTWVKDEQVLHKKERATELASVLETIHAPVQASN